MLPKLRGLNTGNWAYLEELASQLKALEIDDQYVERL
jgi:hypothetical protein